MPGPARAGAMDYARDVERLAAFYAALLSMARLHVTRELVVLESPDFQLVVHAMPPAAAVQASAQHGARLSAVKLFFTVASIADARTIAAALGGEVALEQWRGPGFRVCNARDPEGNVFQVRECAA